MTAFEHTKFRYALKLRDKVTGQKNLVVSFLSCQSSKEFKYFENKNQTEILSESPIMNRISEIIKKFQRGIRLKFVPNFWYNQHDDKILSYDHLMMGKFMFSPIKILVNILFYILFLFLFIALFLLSLVFQQNSTQQMQKTQPCFSNLSK